ncbi:hypothetical protein QAD02_002695 [Eretmocerus hayati]|uniref:Uncharacterized protein n=1 Tax=Eretmocerus hayati TaxID=131215 RepID=A0ACC2NK35_9HYME|nr:hypothetical protein QAD02_002695 [Eretmocerus hayati]
MPRSSTYTKCVFENDFIVDFPWTRPVESDRYSAKCVLCNKVFSLSNMGRQALVSHEKSAKHQNILKILETTPVIIKSSSSPNLSITPSSSSQRQLQMNSTSAPSYSKNSNRKIFNVSSVQVDSSNKKKNAPPALQLIQSGPCKVDNLTPIVQKTIERASKSYKLEVEWKIEGVLRAMYHLMNDSTARKGIYKMASDSDLYPKNFFGIRWLESAPVAKEARKVVPSLKKYVGEVTKDKVEPVCQSYITVKNALTDNFLDAKLAFFQTIAEDLEPVLTESQLNQPEAPYMYEVLRKLVLRIE